MYPRNFIAPDGRVFGYDSNGQMYYVNTAGSGSVTHGGQFSGSARGNDASAAMFRPGRILQFGGISNGAVVIDINGGDADRSHRRLDVVAAPLVNATILARRQGARDRRQRSLEPADRREQHRRDLESEHRHMDASARAAARAPVSLDRVAAAGCQRAGRRRRRAGPAEQHERRDLLPAVPVRRRRCSVRRGRRIDIGTVGASTSARPSPSTSPTAAGDQPRDVVKTRLGDAQLEHGAALRRADVRALSGIRLRCRRRLAPPMRRPVLHAVRARRRRRAFDRAQIVKVNVAANANPASRRRSRIRGNQSGRLGVRDDPCSSSATRSER